MIQSLSAVAVKPFVLRPEKVYEVRGGKVYENGKAVPKVDVNARETFKVQIPVGGVLGKNAELSSKKTSPWIEVVKVETGPADPNGYSKKTFTLKTDPSKMHDPNTGLRVSGALVFDTVEMPGPLKIPVSVWTGPVALST